MAVGAGEERTIRASPNTNAMQNLRTPTVVLALAVVVLPGPVVGLVEGACFVLDLSPVLGLPPGDFDEVGRGAVCEHGGGQGEEGRDQKEDFGVHREWVPSVSCVRAC